MWPVDYILNSVYSPLRVEQQQPGRRWRDAFEDLLALEANGEMISLRSRQEEKTMTVKIRHGIASCIIHMINGRIKDFDPRQNTDTRDDENLLEVKSVMDRVVKAGKAFRKKKETELTLPASEQKERGQWITSLVSSGVLPGWISRYEKRSRSSEVVFRLSHPMARPEEENIIVLTNRELWHRFNSAEHSLIDFAKDLQALQALKVRGASQAAIPPPEEVNVNEDRYVGKSSSRATSDLQQLITQTTTAERLLLPDGSRVNKAIITNQFSNGKEEIIEVVQDAAKVLEEIEKARTYATPLQDCW